MSLDDAEKHARAHRLMATLLRKVGLEASGFDTEDDLFIGYSNVACTKLDLGDGLTGIQAHSHPPKWGIPIGTPLPMGCLARFPRPRTGLQRFTAAPSGDEYEEQLTILWAVYPGNQAEVTYYQGHGSRRVLIPRSDVDVSVPCPLDTTGSSYVRD